ncbi:MAG: ATP-binding protein [Bilifractor sp.]
MFLGRKRELTELNNRFVNGEFECMVIYGRRRVGKTSLINEFCKNKDVIYFPALKDTLKGNLRAISEAIAGFRYQSSAPIYSSFQDALEEIGRIAKTQRIIFVIDEYPYLAKSDPSISSRLQHLIDLRWKDSKMFLILCGSSVSFMEGQVLSYESPLFGRRTGQIHLKPMNYKECAEFIPDADPVTKAEVYGITGGIPMYITKLHVKSTLKDALLNNLFNPSAYLFEEPENLLRQELREPSAYNAIIKAIADGASKIGEISTKSGVQSSSCPQYLKILIELEIIEKETPFGEKEGKRSLYRIKDPFFRFWYRFVPDNIGAIQTGRIERIYDDNIEPYLHDYMGTVFEDMCQQFLMMYDENLPINLRSTGRWWGTDPSSKKQIEIDIIGDSADNRNGKKYIAGSCKFRNSLFTAKDLKDLVDYSRVFSKNAEFYYYSFAVSGFKDDIYKEIDQEHFRFVTLNEMYEV